MTEQIYPEPTVGALIFNKEGKLFLMKSDKWKGKYVIPGGHIELGETIEEALRREIKEETGLNIYDLKFIHFSEFIYGKDFWKKKHFIFFDFACKTDSAEIRLNDEGQEFIWTTPREALSLDTEIYTKNSIKEFIKKFPDKL